MTFNFAAISLLLTVDLTYGLSSGTGPVREAGSAGLKGLSHMGFVFSKRKKVGKNTAVNVSKSGVSASRKMGPLTVNSRGKASVRLGKGLRFKI